MIRIKLTALLALHDALLMNQDDRTSRVDIQKTATKSSFGLRGRLCIGLNVAALAVAGPVGPAGIPFF